MMTGVFINRNSFRHVTWLVMSCLINVSYCSYVCHIIRMGALAGAGDQVTGPFLNPSSGSMCGAFDLWIPLGACRSVFNWLYPTVAAYQAPALALVARDRYPPKPYNRLLREDARAGCLGVMQSFDRGG